MRSHYNDHPRPFRRAGKTGWIIGGVIGRIPSSLWGVDSELDIYLEKVKRNQYSSICRGLIINESDFFPGDSAFICGKVSHDTIFLVR